MNNESLKTLNFIHLALITAFAAIGNLRKISYEIFDKKCKTNPIYPRREFMEDVYSQRITRKSAFRRDQKQTQSKPTLAQKQGSIMKTNPIKAKNRKQFALENKIQIWH